MSEQLGGPVHAGSLELPAEASCRPPRPARAAAGGGSWRSRGPPSRATGRGRRGAAGSPRAPRGRDRASAAPWMAACRGIRPIRPDGSSVKLARMEVRSGMSSSVVTVAPGATLHDAARCMAERKVGAAVVIDPEQPGPGHHHRAGRAPVGGKRAGPEHRAGSGSPVRRAHVRRAGLVARACGRGDGAGAASATSSSWTAARWSACSRCATSSAAGCRTARPRSCRETSPGAPS